MHHPYWHEKQMQLKNRELRESDKHAWKWTQAEMKPKPKKPSYLPAILLLPLRAFGLVPLSKEPPSGE